MFRPGFPRLSHPGLAHATPSTGFIAKVYRGAGKLTDQQRAAQAPTGQRPFQGEDVSLTLAAVMTFDPDLDRLPETLSPTLKTYLIRCLEKDPRERLRDIGDVWLAMQGVFETDVATPRRRFNVPRSWRDVLRVETPWQTAAP